MRLGFAASAHVSAHMAGANEVRDRGASSFLTAAERPTLSFGAGCDGRKVVAARPTCFGVHSTRGQLWLFWRSQAPGWLLFFLSDLLTTLCLQAFSGAASRCYISVAVGQVLVPGGLRVWWVDLRF